MSFRALRLAFLCLALLGTGLISRGGMTADTPYTERGKTDFDTALQLLNPYGTWSKIDGKWAYTPRDHQAPYTNGRWIYTEYGWYWKGRLPHSWVTEHYGYWKRDANKVWSWYPGPFWLPEIIELRATSEYIGWRSGEVDNDGNFVEPPIDRYSKTDEWTFVTLAQFANPITPDLVAPLDVTRTQLEDSTDSNHTYFTYREIDRPGPHPADVAKFCKDGGMLAPMTLADQLAAQHPTPTPMATNSAAAIMAGTNRPTLLGTPTDPAVDMRKVKYWITMSLPTFWTPPPPDAKSNEIYMYRPDFYQDMDGIERRITLWFNPNARTKLSDLLGDSASSPKPSGAAAPATPTGSATPAIPATDDSGNPFRSPFEDSIHASGPGRSSFSSSKNPAPPPTNAADAPIPSPLTNAAPAGLSQ